MVERLLSDFVAPEKEEKRRRRRQSFFFLNMGATGEGGGGEKGKIKVVPGPFFALSFVDG